MCDIALMVNGHSMASIIVSRCTIPLWNIGLVSSGATSMALECKYPFRALTQSEFINETQKKKRMLSGTQIDVRKYYNGQQNLQFESDDANYCTQKRIIQRFIQSSECNQNQPTKSEEEKTKEEEQREEEEENHHFIGKITGLNKTEKGVHAQ